MKCEKGVPILVDPNQNYIELLMPKGVDHKNNLPIKVPLPAPGSLMGSESSQWNSLVQRFMLDTGISHYLYIDVSMWVGSLWENHTDDFSNIEYEEIYKSTARPTAKKKCSLEFQRKQ